MFCLTEFILYFINTWIGPRHIIQQENPIYDQNGDNMGGVADVWIRNQIHVGRIKILLILKLYSGYEYRPSRCVVPHPIVEYGG